MQMFVIMYSGLGENAILFKIAFDGLNFLCSCRFLKSTQLLLYTPFSNPELFIELSN